MFDKVLWLDTETTGLDPKVASILQIGWMAEVDRTPGDIRLAKVQPILHQEDKLYGKFPILEFCTGYNSRMKMHEKDPDRLEAFSFPQGDPLFTHARSALGFNIKPPDIADPADWLLGDGVKPAGEVIGNLIAALDVPGNRWVMAGHNVSFDYKVLWWWSKRIMGDDYVLLMDKINKFVFLDTLSLSRWMQYSGRLPIPKATLGKVAQYLGLDASNAHAADADVALSRDSAKIMLGMETDDA